MSLSLHMPHKIGTMVDELIETVGSRFHIDDGLLEVVQYTMQLQTILHMKYDPWMYLDHPRIIDPIIRSHLMIHMDMVHPRHRLLVVTTLCSLEHLTDQILLPTYSDELLHSHTIILKILLKARI